MVDRQLLGYPRADTPMSYTIRESERRRPLLRSQKAPPTSGSADLSRTEPRAPRLILISFTFDLCVAYEAAEANRNPFAVYTGALNQQPAWKKRKTKQDGKHSRRSNASPARGGKRRPRPPSVTGGTRRSCQDVGSQVCDGGHTCRRTGPHRAPY